ncbi:MAG TPA: signal peptidase I [Terriglobales bacterium]|nr:signal peptidase I [Terriglobales bacterium]
MLNKTLPDKSWNTSPALELPSVKDAPEPKMDAAEKAAPSSEWLLSLQSLLGTVVIAVFVITFVVQAFQIPSESMENTLLIGDYLLVDKFCYGGSSFWNHFLPYKNISRGDIVVFKYPVNPTQHFVKRVVGVPGDRIRLVNKEVFVNGNPIHEPYVRYTSRVHDVFRDDFPRLNMSVPGLEGEWWQQMHRLVENSQLIVPEGHYFVMGDNRDESLDSRYWGFVPRENVIGRPLIIYWSVRDIDNDMIGVPNSSDKLLHFTYAITHLFQITRWDRTFRLVH